MNIQDYIKNNSLKIIVKPNAGKSEILGYDAARQAVKVAIKTPPEKGKANIEVVKFFSKALKKKIKIKSGLTSKEKILVFSD